MPTITRPVPQVGGVFCLFDKYVYEGSKLKSSKNCLFGFLLPDTLGFPSQFLSTTYNVINFLLPTASKYKSHQRNCTNVPSISFRSESSSLVAAASSMNFNCSLKAIKKMGEILVSTPPNSHILIGRGKFFFFFFQTKYKTK